MMKRQMIPAMLVGCFLSFVVGCDSQSNDPQEPSDSDGVPTVHEVLVVDVDEEILPPPEMPKPNISVVSVASKKAPAPAAGPVETSAPKPAPKKVTTAPPTKPNPLKAAFNKDDALAVAEETPHRETPEKKSAPKPKPKDKSPSEKVAEKNDDKADDADPDVKSIRETITAFAQAMEKADTKTFKKNITYTKVDEPVIKAMWAMVRETNGFEKDMKKAYGQAGVDAVKKSQLARMGMTPPSPEDIAKKLSIKVAGNTAKATITGQPEPLNLVKENGQWKVQLFKPGKMQGPTGQMASAMFGAMTQKAKSVRKKIGKPGYDADKIMTEMSKAMTPGPGMMPPDMKMPKGGKR
jgi:hypothetical protein